MYFVSTWSPPRLGQSVGIKQQGHEAEHLLPPSSPLFSKVKNKQEYAYDEFEFDFLMDFFFG
jgi:hypothetical protein